MIEKTYEVKNYKSKIKAIENNICNRCLSMNIYKDDYNIKYCLDCYNYQEISSEMYLYRYDNLRVKKTHELKIDYDLTPDQKKGSSFFLTCFKNNESGFLQAVCGAGKTEMTLEVILKALNNNKSICIVIPRVEVLKELSKRYIEHFPKSTIKTLYSEDKDFESADILFSTPQQLINFYQEFDLIILDEVDAFPFANNIKLERLVNKSIKKTGMILYMSATTNQRFLSIIKMSGLNYYSIDKRFHYLDLPVPILKRTNNNQNLIKILLRIIRKKIFNKRSVIIFVPTIKYGLDIQSILYENKINTEFISSKTIYKKHTIKLFRRKDFLVLITTTLLERGVTFKDIDCVVLKADHFVFTKDTLIQISGRVGRVKEYQEGEVIFLFESMTKSIKSCVSLIKEKNRIKQDDL